MTQEAICPKDGQKVSFSRNLKSGGAPRFDEEEGLWECDCLLTGVCPYEDEIWLHEAKTPSNITSKDTSQISE